MPQQQDRLRAALTAELSRIGEQVLELHRLIEQGGADANFEASLLVDLQDAADWLRQLRQDLEAIRAADEEE